MDDGLRKDDPYRNMDRSDTEPDFLPDKKAEKEQERDAAAEDLRNNEDASVDKGGDEDNSGLPGVREKEEPKHYYVSKVAGKHKGKNKKRGPKGAKGFWKKGGPVTSLIIGLVLGGGVLFSGSQAFQFVAWFQNINSMFGKPSAILNIRTNTVIRKMFSSHYDVTRTDMHGYEKYKIKPDSNMAKRMKANNIDVVETTGTDGKKLKMLVYNDTDGSKIPIVASDIDIDRIPASYRGSDGVDVQLSKGYVLDDAKTKIKNFNTDLETSTIKLTGKIAGWFDSLSEMLFRRIGGDDARNPLKKVKDKSDVEEVEEALFKNASDGADDGNTSNVKKEEVGEDGKKTTEVDVTKQEIEKAAATDADGKVVGEVTDGKMKPGDIDAKNAESKLKTRISQMAVGANVACMVLRGIGAINAMIGGAQLANSIRIALTYLSITNQMMAGDGDESFNIAMNAANTSTKTTAYTRDGKEVVMEGAMTESNGFNNAFSDKNIVSEDDPGALMVNREYATQVALRNTEWSGLGGADEIMSKIGSAVGSFGNSVAAFTICNGIQAAMGVADFVGDALLFFGTAGIGTAVKQFFDGIWSAVKVTAAIGALGVAISLLAPVVGTWLSGNLKSIFMNKIGGYALESGAKVIYDDNTQIMSGKNDTKEEAIELMKATKEVEKEWIAYDRAMMSPFDITSKYTFMGSLMNKVVPVLSSFNKSIISTISSSTNVVGDAIVSLSGNVVSAANEVSDFESSFSSEENCPNLAGMGLAADMYCNRYSGAYINELATYSSGEIFDSISDNFEIKENCDPDKEDCNPPIKKDSDYARYIVACNTNDAQPGTMSAVVQGYINGAYNSLSGGSTIGSALISIGSGFIPFEGVADLFSAGEEQANIKWNSQEVCSDPKYSNFSNYGVDQRVLEELGVIEKSAITAFLEDYYEENPLDNSYEGVLARYSGMTKEQVADTLALIEYVDYVANYDPAERYAFGQPDVERPLMFDNEHTLAVDVMMPLGEIVYSDVRNRNFVV